MGLLLGLLDEVLDSGGHREAQILKNLITEERRIVEAKGKDAVYVKDMINYVVVTNNDFSSVMEESNRRYLAIRASDEVCMGQPGAKEYWDSIYKPLMTKEAGLNIFHWLLNRDLSGFDRRVLPETEYTVELKVRQSNSAIQYLLYKSELWLETGMMEEMKMTNPEVCADFANWQEFLDPHKGRYVKPLGNILNAAGFRLNGGDKIDGDDKRYTAKRRTFSVALIEEKLRPYIFPNDRTPARR
ncbi:unnamed protein product [Phytophthora lilii]|uniref:Unnamed protein product n=1 Tax=Phytophthora lilii TaxID=2077276 RepID=A0A9W6WRE8_9STRA|nr:unnamed protein product [Phytophthora lilii]